MTGPLPSRAKRDQLLGLLVDRDHVHAVDLVAGDAEGHAAVAQARPAAARLTEVPMAYWLFSIT